MDEREFGPSVEPADDAAGLPVADEHGEPAKITVSDLAEIVGAENLGDHRYVGGIKLIGHADVWLCLGIVIRHIRLRLHRPRGFRNQRRHHLGEGRDPCARWLEADEVFLFRALDRIDGHRRIEGDELPVMSNGEREEIEISDLSRSMDACRDADGGRERVRQREPDPSALKPRHWAWANLGTPDFALPEREPRPTPRACGKGWRGYFARDLAETIRSRFGFHRAMC